MKLYRMKFVAMATQIEMGCSVQLFTLILKLFNDGSPLSVRITEFQGAVPKI